jgi:hypothetical protein
LLLLYLIYPNLSRGICRLPLLGLTYLSPNNLPIFLTSFFTDFFHDISFLALPSSSYTGHGKIW